MVPRLALTDGYTRDRRQLTLRTASLHVAGVLVVFTLLGGTTSFKAEARTIFQLFGIMMDAFRIAGGIIIFAIGLDMVQKEDVVRTRSVE